MSNTLECSPWKMNKADLTRALDRLQIPVHPRWSVPELRQVLVEATRDDSENQDKLKGLGRMKLDELKKRCDADGISYGDKAARGLLMRLIRDKNQPEGEQVVTFGKYKSWMYKEIPKGYLEWTIKETAQNPNSSPDLVKLSEWARVELRRREGLARQCGAVPEREDPEYRARVHPPALSMDSWSVASSAPLPRANAKRGAAEPEEKMLVEVPDAAREEINRLRTELAMMKQKYQVDDEVDNAERKSA